jgi:hypothetical protein
MASPFFISEKYSRIRVSEGLSQCLFIQTDVHAIASAFHIPGIKDPHPPKGGTLAAAEKLQAV